jgi:hypothetical protein
LKIYAEFTYKDGDDIIRRPVFFEEHEKWLAYAQFNKMVNHIIDNYELLKGSAPVIVNEVNEAALKERAEVFPLTE